MKKCLISLIIFFNLCSVLFTYELEKLTGVTKYFTEKAFFNNLKFLTNSEEIVFSQSYGNNDDFVEFIIKYNLLTANRQVIFNPAKFMVNNKKNDSIAIKSIFILNSMIIKCIVTEYTFGTIGGTDKLYTLNINGDKIIPTQLFENNETIYWKNQSMVKRNLIESFYSSDGEITVVNADNNECKVYTLNSEISKNIAMATSCLGGNETDFIFCYTPYDKVVNNNNTDLLLIYYDLKKSEKIKEINLKYLLKKYPNLHFYTMNLLPDQSYIIFYNFDSGWWLFNMKTEKITNMFLYNPHKTISFMDISWDSKKILLTHGDTVYTIDFQTFIKAYPDGVDCNTTKLFDKPVNTVDKEHKVK